MANVVTVRVYRPDLTPADSELCELVQTLAGLELNHLRTRTQGHNRTSIQTALADGLARVTDGTIDEHDLPLAAAAMEHGDEITIKLVTTPPATHAET